MIKSFNKLKKYQLTNGTFIFLNIKDILEFYHENGILYIKTYYTQKIDMLSNFFGSNSPQFEIYKIVDEDKKEFLFLSTGFKDLFVLFKKIIYKMVEKTQIQEISIPTFFNKNCICKIQTNCNNMTGVIGTTYGESINVNFDTDIEDFCITFNK